MKKRTRLAIVSFVFPASTIASQVRPLCASLWYCRVPFDQPLKMYANRSFWTQRISYSRCPTVWWNTVKTWFLPACIPPFSRGTNDRPSIPSGAASPSASSSVGMKSIAET